jgi:hypothetical protein
MQPFKYGPYINHVPMDAVDQLVIVTLAGATLVMRGPRVQVMLFINMHYKIKLNILVFCVRVCCSLKCNWLLPYLYDQLTHCMQIIR